MIRGGLILFVMAFSLPSIGGNIVYPEPWHDGKNKRGSAECSGLGSNASATKFEPSQIQLFDHRSESKAS